MSIIGYLIIWVARVIGFVLNLYIFVLAAAIIFTWIRPDPMNPIVRLVYQLTSPVLTWARRFIPRRLWQTGIDFSPVIVFMVIMLLETVVVNLLMDLGKTFLHP